jgi:TatD DNase family protein
MRQSDRRRHLKPTTTDERQRFSMFVDSHAHLDGNQFDADREAGDCARAGGRRAHDGCDRQRRRPRLGRCAIRLAEQYEFMYATHWDSSARSPAADEAAYQKHGETGEASQGDRVGRDWAGLFLRSLAARCAEAVFPKQMELAKQAKLPIVIHCRPSEGATMPGTIASADREQWAPNGLGGILHCFTGNLGAGKARARYGIHDFLRRKPDVPQGATDSRRGARSSAGSHVDRDGLSVLAPVPNRGKRNEPAFVEGNRAEAGRIARAFGGRGGRRPRATSTVFSN